MIFALFFPKIFPKDQLELLDSPAVEELILRNLKVEPILQEGSGDGANEDDPNAEGYSGEDIEVSDINSHLTNRCRQSYSNVDTEYYPNSSEVYKLS
ncbi:unnamed protein product [[Candida] boidinii]|nr:unnamed protein product [[Candida] boidinii]